MKRADASASLGAFGPYRLEEVVRGGPVFSTFRATHSVGGHTVWITMTPLSAEPSASAGLRLRAAATALAALGRDAALGLMDVIEEGARVAVVTQAPRGPSLRAIIDELSSLTGLDAEHRAALAVAFVRAVAEVNDAGVVHGALCPDSAYLTPRGSVQLGAFWDATLLGGDAQETPRDIPEAGPEERYRSPERISGKSVDPASDVFSAAVVCFEIIAGRHPFAEERQGESLARRIRTADPSPSLAGELLDEVLLKGLQKIPTLRHESAARLADDLTAALGGPSRLAALSRALFARLRGRPEVVVPERLEQKSTRLARRLAVLGAAMLLIGVGLAGEGPGRPPSAGPAGASSASVRVLARPWADVYVDGERVDTTPVGHPIPLSPGRHEILFRHPRAAEEKRVIEVVAGELVTVDVDMEVQRPVDAGVESP